VNRFADLISGETPYPPWIPN